MVLGIYLQQSKTMCPGLAGTGQGGEGGGKGSVHRAVPCWAQSSSVIMVVPQPLDTSSFSQPDSYRMENLSHSLCSLRSVGSRQSWGRRANLLCFKNTNPTG